MSAAGPSTNPSQRTTPSGLKIIDVQIPGEPMTARAGDTVWVHFVGKLQADGTQFGTSQGGEPLSFILGTGRVIKGWDEGIVGMKVGDKRQLIVPPELAYGEHGSGKTIPANATLIFDLTLVGISHPE